MYKPAIVDLRASMCSMEDGLAEEALYEWSIEIRDLYFDIYENCTRRPNWSTQMACWLRKGRSEVTLGEYTTRGHITIEGTELRASVNSSNRATKLRKEIEKRLGERVTHQATTEENAQMGEAVDEILEAHWMRWLDERIPALGSLSPRQAVKDKDGRERLIALLQDFERHEKRKPGGRSQLEYVQRVRKELGLE